MAEVNYVMAPDSFSLYHRPDGGEVGIFGDDHSIVNGNDARAIPVSQYIRRRLEVNPDLHIYAEIPEGGVSRGYANTELDNVRRLSKNASFPHRNRIHNIDNRFNEDIISSDLYEHTSKRSVRDVGLIVKDYVDEKAPELLPLFRRERTRAMEEISDNPDQEDVEFAKDILMNVMVDADAVDVIKTNPHGSRDMLFYVGSGHKNGIETYLDNPASGHTLLYKRTAQPQVPLAISRTDSI